MSPYCPWCGHILGTGGCANYLCPSKVRRVVLLRDGREVGS